MIIIIIIIIIVFTILIIIIIVIVCFVLWDRKRIEEWWIYIWEEWDR